MHNKLRFFFCCLLIFFVKVVNAQQASEAPAANKYESEIAAFEQADKQIFPPKNAILFTGSSSIRLWKDLQERFPNKKVINRGFGGSGLADLVYYKERIVMPYKPKQIVIYSGENDIAAGKSAQEVYTNLVTLVSSIRKALPAVRISYISMKPSPSRLDKQEEMKKANRMIKDYLSKVKRADYINIYDPMLGPDGQPKAELFVEDRLHMNKAGYDIWAAVIKPYLVK
jgi:lysophospholipase L1-like esterase